MTCHKSAVVTCNDDKPVFIFIGFSFSYSVDNLLSEDILVFVALYIILVEKTEASVVTCVVSAFKNSEDKV